MVQLEVSNEMWAYVQGPLLKNEISPGEYPKPTHPKGFQTRDVDVMEIRCLCNAFLYKFKPLYTIDQEQDNLNYMSEKH
jgi:hypothetical protein